LLDTHLDFSGGEQVADGIALATRAERNALVDGGEETVRPVAGRTCGQAARIGQDDVGR